jgi:Na+-translocating ferredoxin:NAD+ oxidoreductase RnfD subunit
LDLFLRIAGAVVSLWGAVLLAIAGAFLTPFRVGTVLVPVSVLLAVAGNAVLVWLARRTTGHKFLTVAPGLVWLGVTFLALDRTNEGDLVLYQQNWVSLVYLLAGAATVAYLGYRALVPEAPTFGPR